MKPPPLQRLVILSRLQPAKNLLLLVLCAVAASQAADNSVRPQKQMRYLMGTLCEITAYPEPGKQEETDTAIAAAFDELKRMDAALSNWKPDSDLMLMNSAAGRVTADGHRPKIPVTPELFERIQTALNIAQATGGRFDPTVGPLVRVWGFLPSDAKPLAREQAIAEAREKVGWEKINLDPDARTVQFTVAGMEIDLGGIAKGYAAQRALQVLREHQVKTALVSLGGSSMAALGSPPGLTGWPVLIRDPRDGESPAARLELRDGESLATSGTYENTVGEGKARRSHIIDPHTGQAVGGSISVTILLNDANAEIADALTKPFFLEPSHTAPNRAKWLATFPNASIILLAARDGKLERVTGGVHPERFLAVAPDTTLDDAAKTNRRSAQHLARDDARGPGHPASPLEACRPETYCAAGHDPARLP